MKKSLKSFTLLLPVISLLIAIGIIVVPALHFYYRLKPLAHGSEPITLRAGEFQMEIQPKELLPFSFQRATWWAEKPITILDVPGLFVGLPISWLLSLTNWNPELALFPLQWRPILFPVYALPAWLYVGCGIDGLLGRRRVGRINMIFSIVIATAFALMCGGLECGISAAERQGQARLGWSIQGLALWTLLFAIPSVAWLIQRRKAVWGRVSDPPGWVEDPSPHQP